MNIERSYVCVGGPHDGKRVVHPSARGSRADLPAVNYYEAAIHLGNTTITFWRSGELTTIDALKLMLIKYQS